MGIKAVLPSYELGFYALILTCAVVYSGTGIFEASRDNMNRKAFRQGIKPGWHYFGRKMDAADFEWAMWFTSFRNIILFALSGHVLFAKICSMVAPQHRSVVYMLYGMLAVLGAMGRTYLMIVLSHCVLLYTVALAKQRWLCFAAGLCSLASFRLEPFSTWQVSTSELRRKDNEMWNIRVHAFLHLGAIVTVDVFFHFFYILTLPTDVTFVNRLSDWALAGLAYSNLVYDWVKAAVMFGIINTIARLDHLDPPQPPKCITMLYVFAETHFDRGINDWLCKYVYDHLGQNHDDVVKELRATICTFAITTLWLGPCEIVYIWSVCNCFGLNFELWVQKVFQLEPFGSMEARMSESMSRRIRGIFGAANFWAIVFYNVLALNSLEFTLLVAKRILLTGFPLSTLSIWFITYCGVQLIKERERLLAIEEEKRDKEKAA